MCLDELLLRVVCTAASVSLPEQDLDRKDRRSNPGIGWLSVRFALVGLLERWKWPGATVVARSSC